MKLLVGQNENNPKRDKSCLSPTVSICSAIGSSSAAVCFTRISFSTYIQHLTVILGLRMALAQQPHASPGQHVWLSSLVIICCTQFPQSVNVRHNVAVVEQKKMSLQNKYGEKLVGILHDTGSKELVVLCHGFRSNKEHYIMVNIATGLEKEKISAFRFDFSGNGESEGSFTYVHYFREADDLYSVVEHFTSLGYNVIAVVGHSKGGDVVLLYASKYRNINKVVNLSGRYDLRKGIEERLGKDFLEQLDKDGFIDVKQNKNIIYRVTKESLVDRLETDMHKASLMIDKSCRVLTVHGSADEIIPVEDGKEFAKIIPNHKLHIIEGADHCYSQHQAELIPVVVDFIKSGNSQD